MAAKKKLKVTEMAERIAELRAKQAAIKAKQIEPLEKEEEELKAKLIVELKGQGMKYIRLEGIGIFGRTLRESVAISPIKKDEAFDWADMHDALKVDTSKVLKLLQKSLEPIPDCFTIEQTEYISVRKDTGEDKEE